MASQPNTVSATVASGLPVGLNSYRRGYIESADGTPGRFTEIIAGGTELLPTLGISMVHGRPWDARDPRGAPVAVLSHTTARTLFGRLVPAIDPVVVVLVPTLFICAAVLACYIPARRAASVEPNRALRHV